MSRSGLFRAVWVPAFAGMTMVWAVASAAVTAADLRALQAADQRVMDIGHRLSTRGVALCPNAQEPLSGLRAHILGQYGRGDQVAAADYFALGPYPAVLALAKGSQAERAGVRVNDWIVSIANEDMRAGPGQGYVMAARVETALRRGLEGGRPVTLIVKRDGIERVYLFKGDRGCASTVELIPSAKLNAKADGRIVQVTTGVLEQTRDDDELAFVIAHEMAHNILRHAEARGRKRDEEMAADRLGLTLMKAAGYDPAAAARFWVRFGAKTGFGIFSDGTHMRTKARVQFLASEALKLAQ